MFHVIDSHFSFIFSILFIITVIIIDLQRNNLNKLYPNVSREDNKYYNIDFFVKSK